MSRRILAVALSCLLSGIALPGQTPPTGVVLQSASARLNATDAAVGSTIFDGDRMETQEKGALSLRSGQEGTRFLQMPLGKVEHVQLAEVEVLA